MGHIGDGGPCAVSESDILKCASSQILSAFEYGPGKGTRMLAGMLRKFRLQQHETERVDNHKTSSCASRKIHMQKYVHILIEISLKRVLYVSQLHRYASYSILYLYSHRSNVVVPIFIPLPARSDAPVQKEPKHRRAVRAQAIPL